MDKPLSEQARQLGISVSALKRKLKEKMINRENELIKCGNIIGANGKLIEDKNRKRKKI